MKMSKSYWTVNHPYGQTREERKVQREILWTNGYRENTQARNTKKVAEDLAKEIKKKFGFDMEVNETCDF